jgi:hypothetical protein
MCLLVDDQDIQPVAHRRRRLALMVLLLVTLFFAIGLLHPEPGADADFFDFLRGLLLGIALVFAITASTLCGRRPRSHT